MGLNSVRLDMKQVTDSQNLEKDNMEQFPQGHYFNFITHQNILIEMNPSALLLRVWQM